MPIRRTIVLGLTVTWFAPAAALAEGPLQDVQWVRDEVPDDPHRLGGGVTSAAGDVVFGGFVSIQVNVDEFGNNIVGDAANEPSIAVDPTAPNRMSIGWRQFDTIASNFRQAGWGWSHDGGRSWTFPGVLEPGNFRSDPVLDSNSLGTFFYYSLGGNFLCDMFISADGGVSWLGPIPAFGGDKAWFVVDRTGGQGDGHIYASWSVFAGCCGDDTFIRSTDEGFTYSRPDLVPQTPLFGTLAVGPVGDLFISGRSPSNASDFIVSRSVDADEVTPPTFDLSSNVDLGGVQLFSAGPNPAGLLGQVNVAADPNSSAVYLLCTVDPPGDDPLDVMFARSRDNGATWSPPVRVNNDPGPPFGDVAWQWFGTMSVAPNGRIDVIFNDTRNSGQVNISQLFYASSDDGGVTWSPDIPLSPAFDSFVGWPQQNKLGDYYDMVSDDVGAHVAYAATFNGEQDVYYLRIGDYDCNGNGVGDPDDLDDGTSHDCNANDIPDECEIAAGTVADDNGNGIPDECEAECPWDLDGDGQVSTQDLLDLLAQWRTDPGGPPDFDGDGTVSTPDLLEMLANWGPC